MREYFTISNISEYAATNLKGDCGVQAILFITLCRIAGYQPNGNRDYMFLHIIQAVMIGHNFI